MLKGEHFVAMSIFAVVLWNCYIAPPGEAVSDVLRRWAAWSPIVPFLFGVLLGHVFWNR